MQVDEVLQLPLVSKPPGTSAAQPHTRPPPSPAHCQPPLHTQATPQQIASLKKPALLLSPPQEPTGEMASSQGKTAPLARPASQRPSCLQVNWPAWTEAQCIASPTPTPNTASVHTALQGTPPPSRHCLPEGVPMLPVVPQTQTTVKNRASLLAPVSSGTRFSHKHTGWQSLLGKRAGPEPGLLGTDTE